MPNHNTKYWNKNMDLLHPDEKLYFDYKDNDKTVICSAKFKTNRSKEWIKTPENTFQISPELKKSNIPFIDLISLILS